jgi:DICT domain-containing protein/signal transduction histidine kinase
MIIRTSSLQDLLQAQPHLKSQMYFKSSLTALSHAMEDQVLAGGEDQPLVIASFQRERFYRQEAHRYLRIAGKTQQVYVLAAPEAEFRNCSDHYETVAFEPEDALSQEWHLVVVGQQYAICLMCREHSADTILIREPEVAAMDQARRFEGIWTFDRSVACWGAQLLLQRILQYRPELEPKIQQALAQLDVDRVSGFDRVDPAPFADRLMTYLQAGQYRLLKAYRHIAEQERKERLINSITTTIRRSMDLDQILRVAAQELGQALHGHRCLIYCCKGTDAAAQIQHEFTSPEASSLLGQTWPLQNNPFFQEVVCTQEKVHVPDLEADSRLASASGIQSHFQEVAIRSLLMVPVLYQGRLLGIVELHHCDLDAPHTWSEHELSLIDAITTQVGVALIQAEAYADLEDLNQQLEALDRTRSNLIAITGHELRTPLSTIQVCLESLATEPDMSLELQQVMLNSALADAERLRKLVQDFLTLSQLESGRVDWNPEPLPLRECVDLALSSIRARQPQKQVPQIQTQVPLDLPLVSADGEWLVEVLSKLLDNACKFTEPDGAITISAQANGSQMLEVTVTDTGRGIEPEQLETVFDRFYQEEGALRRTTGGTGLGLAICRQIVNNLGGKIWAESAGKDQGSRFHFTLPSVKGASEQLSPTSGRRQPRATLHQTKT